jgi:hypothetical protein
VKLPVPIPLAVILLAVVGAVEVPQQTPRAVTLAPPSEVIFPPAVAVVVAIADGVVVLRVSTAVSGVVNDTSLP